jgi:hypothetical protein
VCFDKPLSGLSNLSFAHWVEITETLYLENLDGLNNLETLHSLDLSENNNLNNIDGLSNLQTIEFFNPFICFFKSIYLLIVNRVNPIHIPTKYWNN